MDKPTKTVYTIADIIAIRQHRLVNAILSHLMDAHKEGADRVYFGALATEDDETTLGDLVEELSKTSRVRVWFEGGRAVKAVEVK